MNITQSGVEDQTAISTLDGAAQNNGMSDMNATLMTSRTKNQSDQLSNKVRVVNEKEFNHMMSAKASSRQWRALECIQSCIKAQKGLGKHIPIKFVMQMDF